ncbi:MAG: hypothetical protein IKX38_03080 [Bacteroidales bacterium]|nr:hypothetical protein [Bacteroidales bacterium]
MNNNPVDKAVAFQIKTYSRALAFFLSIVALSIGGGIYFLYCSKTLLMFRWADALNVTGHIENLRQSMSIYNPSDFVKYNLPDGLWSISYFLIIFSIWGKVGGENIVWFCLMPIIALILEFMQLTAIIPGHFDWWDVVCYSLPLIILITITIVKICTRKKSYHSLQ